MAPLALMHYAPVVEGRRLETVDWGGVAGAIIAGIVIIFAFGFCIYDCCIRKKSESVGAVAPEADPPAPPPKSKPAPAPPPAKEEAPPKKVLLISDVKAFGVPGLDTRAKGAGDGQVFMKFLLTKDAKAKTACMPNAADPVWYGCPILPMPEGKTASLSVLLMDDNVTSDDKALGSTSVTVDLTKPENVFTKEATGSATTSFKITTMLESEAMAKRKAAAKLVADMKAKMAADKAAADKAAALARAAKAKARKAEEERKRKEAEEKAAAAAAAAAAAKEAAEKAAAEAADEEAKAKAEAEAAAAKEAEEKAAAEAAAEAAKLKAEAEEQARLEAEYTLIFSEIAAHDVPNADKLGGSSDPYVRFTILNCDGVETGRTQPAWNDCNPKFPHNVQLTLPAGSEAAMTRQVTVKVSVFDKDMTDDDDMLGTTTVTLAEQSGSKTKLELAGCKDFAGCSVSFSWKQVDEVPPPATLKITNVHASDIPAGSGRRELRKPYLTFKLLEVGDFDSEARTAAMANVASPKYDGDLTLEVPKGCPRPALVQVSLWDEDTSNEDDMVCECDVRLDDSGTVEDRKVVGKRGFKNASVSFSYERVVEGGY